MAPDNTICGIGYFHVTGFIQIELNEVNFDFVIAYGHDRLPALNALIQRHGLQETVSEQRYEDLEPWIQWVTAHTGRTLDEHGVFRLGDIVDRHDLRQVWEELEARGLRVGAVSPMNAANRCRSPAFFIPDLWTQTGVSGSPLLKRMHRAVAGAANDNATGGGLGLGGGLSILAGTARFARPGNGIEYLRFARGSVRSKWNRALALDRLLADMFVTLTRANRPDFATLFLNAAAHIQHHYLFNAGPYLGDQRNPDWYLAPGADPVLEAYRLYDRIVAGIAGAFPEHRLVIATGLHQDPYPGTLHYWRLRAHDEFLRAIGVPFQWAEPRMSRDFAVYCADQRDAAEATRLLGLAVADDGQALFTVDNRGVSLFVELVYPHSIPAGLGFTVGNRHWPCLREWVAHVALKNGQHNGIGYLIDTATEAGPRAGKRQRVPLASLYALPFEHFGLVSAAPPRRLAALRAVPPGKDGGAGA